MRIALYTITLYYNTKKIGVQKFILLPEGVLRVLLIHWSELKLANLGPQLGGTANLGSQLGGNDPQLGDMLHLAIVHQMDRGQEAGRGLIAGEGLVAGVDRGQEAEKKKECALEQDTKLLVLDTAPLHQASRRVKGTQQQSHMKAAVPCTTHYQIPRVIY